MENHLKDAKRQLERAFRGDEQSQILALMNVLENLILHLESKDKTQ
jgi:hypothetical protein